MFDSILRRLRLIVRVIFFAALLSASGCTSFNHEWKKAATQSTTSGIAGRWEGVWTSDVNHHAGALRCVVTARDDGTYRARFHATYNRVLTFGYTVPLQVIPATNGFQFSGDANLGWLAGGVYHYAGHTDATNFFSTYTCKYDHGTFQMERR